MPFSDNSSFLSNIAFSFVFLYEVNVYVSVSAAKMIEDCFFRQTPEVEKARETWENYKKDYQTSYEKMQVKM